MRAASRRSLRLATDWRDKDEKEKTHSFPCCYASLTKVLTETEFYAFAEKAFALLEVKDLLMEAVNEHNKNEFGGD